MATKEQLYSIIAAYGLGRALPAGSTRTAAKTAVRGMVKAKLLSHMRHVKLLPRLHQLLAEEQ